MQGQFQEHITERSRQIAGQVQEQFKDLLRNHLSLYVIIATVLDILDRMFQAEGKCNYASNSSNDKKSECVPSNVLDDKVDASQIKAITKADLVVQDSTDVPTKFEPPAEYREKVVSRTAVPETVPVADTVSQLIPAAPAADAPIPAALAAVAVSQAAPTADDRNWVYSRRKKSPPLLTQIHPNTYQWNESEPKLGLPLHKLKKNGHLPGISLPCLDLPPELLDKIVKRLPSEIDICCFHAVCHCWLSSTPPYKFPTIKLPFPSHPKSNLDPKHSGAYCTLTQRGVYRIQFPDSKYHDIWLVKVERAENDKVKILNPVNHRKIQSPAAIEIPKVLNILNSSVSEVCKELNILDSNLLQ
ncbi:hypothetical protein C2S52_008767 [Perilla frutescens var. hirtella]|nr:hypothetical protein C2S52_008767 [Perilla frutescens var. hirtella]